MSQPQSYDKCQERNGSYVTCPAYKIIKSERSPDKINQIIILGLISLSFSLYWLLGHVGHSDSSFSLASLQEPALSFSRITQTFSGIGCVILANLGASMLPEHVPHGKL
jgi:hypothetical protein